MNLPMIQGGLSIAAIFCIAVGYLNIFSPEVNDFLYRRLFYILIGISFFFMAPTLQNRSYVYPMYVAAAMCIAGAFLDPESDLAKMKTIGLFAGFLISIFQRPRPVRQ